tara:strand:+ start:1521 stop:1691 length:171 start_codon:yes stop_codon:yes gene_type:complete
MFAIGNTVKVNTKFHGWKVGTIIGKADWDSSMWLVKIPGHMCKQTAALAQDMKKVA